MKNGHRGGPASDLANREIPELDDIVPVNPNVPYDMHHVIRHVVDDGRFFEIHSDYAPNVICGFAHIAGRSVGIVANQPMHLAGVLDIDASLKGASVRTSLRCL